MAPLHPQWQRLREARARAGTPPLYTLPLDRARADDLAALRSAGGTPEPVARVEESVIPGPGGPLTVRLYHPATTPGLPVLLYLYGGGWTLGCLDTADGVSRGLANAAGCVVASVGYRLAPEHPFPAAVHDSHAALRWLYANAARLGLDATRVAVGGDSAGGNLAAAVALLHRDDPGPRLRHQLLVYPNTDYRPPGAPSAQDGEDPLLFNRHSVDWYWSHYLAAPDDGADPLASPLRAADLSGLPPATVITAEYDPLRDEGERYAERLRAAAVPVSLHRFTGMAHGFFTMTATFDDARAAQRLAARRLREAFGEGSGGAEPDPGELLLDDLHGSLSDTLLDRMTFLNEAPLRYPDAVSFAPGRPYEGLFDPAEVPTALEAYLTHLRETEGLGPDAVRERLFQYGRTKGFINDLIARQLHADEGIVADPEAIVVTAGAQEGMLLVLRALCAGPDDVLLVASPCYVGITGAARLLDVTVVPVPESADGGLDPEAVAAAVREQRAAGRRPRACYVVPDFANPSGASLSVPARRRLLEVAAEAGLLVVEDDPYGFFALDGQPRPTLKALDTGRRVIHIGSYAKTCLPGARIGYVVADQRVRGPHGTTVLADELAKLKSMTTVNTSAVSQAVIGGMLLRCDFRLRQANKDAGAFYAGNLRTLLDALESAFPADRRDHHGVSWNLPEGGFFVVVTLPFAADERAMERCAREYGVLWTPMSGFHPAGGGERTARLSCSYLTPAHIRDGVRRLAAFVAAVAAEEGGPVSGSAG